VRGVKIAKHGVACDRLEPCKKWHRHPQILFGVFKPVGGWFLESGTDTHRLSTHVYIYISAYPSILENSKNPFLVYNCDSPKDENVKEPARDLSVLSENRRFFDDFFVGGGEGEITATNRLVLWSEFSWKNRNRWLYDYEMFKEPIETCDLLEMQRTAEHWLKGSLSTEQITDPNPTLENYTIQRYREREREREVHSTKLRESQKLLESRCHQSKVGG
jgi:hypothetical protein